MRSGTAHLLNQVENRSRLLLWQGNFALRAASGGGTRSHVSASHAVGLTVDRVTEHVGT
jgi:hypothetical protein